MTETKMTERLTWLLTGAAIGAGVLFLFDPQQGRRRRSLGMDKITHYRNSAQDEWARQMRNLNNHVQGWMAEGRKLVRNESTPNDAKLAQRVRSAMGRKVRHAHAIDVLVNNGEVTLRGPVLSNEVQRLFNTVRSVRGVNRVVNELEVHRKPDRIPSLQGEGKEYFQRH